MSPADEGGPAEAAKIDSTQFAEWSRFHYKAGHPMVLWAIYRKMSKLDDLGFNGIFGFQSIEGFIEDHEMVVSRPVIDCQRRIE